MSPELKAALLKLVNSWRRLAKANRTLSQSKGKTDSLILRQEALIDEFHADALMAVIERFTK